MENYPTVLPPKKNKNEVIRLLQKYPLAVDKSTGTTMQFSYGTAGFRYNASLLDAIMIRVGILASVRSSLLKSQVGIMVTASHNDESYNGVKIADPNGGMMSSDGEELAVQLANASLEEILEFLDACNISDTTIVHVGRDTRSHSPHLAHLAVSTIQAMGATVVSHGIVTTPMLHHAVLHANPKYLPILIPPRPNAAGYYDLLAHSYHALLLTAETSSLQVPREPLVVDCACGVGYEPVVKLNGKLQELSPYCCKLVAVNAPGEGPLNESCGSEHVQKEVSPPKWYNDTSDVAPHYAASLDGDADRIVFFTTLPSGQFALLDGDKIAVLVSDFIQHQVDSLKKALQSKGAKLAPLTLGVVQTAYANGASTAYLKSVLENGVMIAKTGVKHVQAAAHDNFDIAVYFEANGHGTVLFSNAFYKAMSQAHGVVPGNVALRRLCLLPSLVNQAVGDALSDLLLVDAILYLKQKWDIETWNNLYADLPSRQCKVKVQDRSMIMTNENETRATQPVELQEALDQVMLDVSGRCFVRPSGTENVVRVYAEAKTSQDADALASKAADLVYRLCNGVGEAPSFPSSNL